MTIGTPQIQALPIQAVGLVYQAATATPPVVSTTMEATTAPGGLLQSPVPTLGSVVWTSTATMSAGKAPIVTTAFLLVASGIKT